MTAHRYPLCGTRELRVARTHGVVFVAVHDLQLADGRRALSGTLAVRDAELDALRSALADLSDDAGPAEATPDAQASRQGDVSRGGGTP
ncbi:MAG TPA: hypothetical protein VFG23_18890 [Polyangia bacterium]|nr:hypothetical protein [Polyangia bacterium]